MNLNIEKWKTFRLGDLIDEIYKSKAYNKTDLQTFDYYDANLIPYVSRTESNNSVDCFVEKNNFEKIEVGNAIIIGDTTSTVSYQKDCFVTGDHIVVIRAKWLNEFTGLFIATLLQMEKYRYSYGRAYVVNSIVNTMIKLPVDNNDNPDWNWMKEYMESLHCQLPKTQKKGKLLSLNFDNWKKFKVNDIFNCSTTKALDINEAEEGKIPYITRSAVNNGLSGYYGNEEYINDGNCITIGAEGRVAFYQKDNFIAGIKVYTLRNKELNKYNALFISTILNQKIDLYNYGRARILDKIKDESIYLPINENGNPDYAFMEKYIKQLPYADLL